MKRSLRNLLFFGLTGWTVMTGCGSENAPNNDSKLDIVGGTVVTASEYTARYKNIVSLQYGGSHFCGGTLVAANKVLTAAHCLADFSSSQIRNNIKVVIGTSNLTSTASAEKFSVSSYWINSGYNSSTMRNDIATITLSGNSKVTPAVVNKSASFPTVGSTLYVAGWGSTREGGNVTSTLRHVGVAAISNTSCASAYGSDIYAGNICASSPGKDSCQGDSGGPLYALDSATNTYQVVGVVSWGIGCARSGYPGVYTRASSFSF